MGGTQATKRAASRSWMLLWMLPVLAAWSGCGSSSESTVEAAPASDRARQSSGPILLGTPPPRDELPGQDGPGAEGSGRLERGPAAAGSPGSSAEQDAARAASIDPTGAKGPRFEAPDEVPVAGAALARAVERAIAKAMGTANKRSKGKVHGNNTVVAVHVVDLASGQELVSRQAGASLLPASNLKLITLAAALAELGAGHQIVTPLEAHGTISGGTLAGDLVMRAAGDPLYDDSPGGGIQPWARAVAGQLRAAGIDRVSGDLVLDEGDFAAPSPGPQWPSSKEHWKEYCALSGGFSANAGCYTAIVEATSPGQKARVRLTPAGSGAARNGSVKTVAKRKALTVAVGAVPGKVTVRGSIPADVPSYTARFAAPDPVALFGAAFVHALGEEGIRIEGQVVRAHVPDGGQVVARMESPLASCALPILRDSNNSVADQVFLHLAHATGQAPDRAGGQAAVSAALTRLGVSAEGLVQVDGSGLSKANRTSPRQLTALVAAAMGRDGAGAELIRANLPVAGETGSLSRRMRSGPARGRVRAKTGFVNGASGLSGLVETESGRLLAFSILVNYPHYDGLNTHAFKPMQDAICEAMVTSVPAATNR